MTDKLNAAQIAQVLIDSHGREAVAVAKWRADYFKESGDLISHEAWLSIIQAIELLAG